MQVSSSKRARGRESCGEQAGGQGEGTGSCANHSKLFADKCRTQKCLGCLVWAPRVLHRPVLIPNHLNTLLPTAFFFSLKTASLQAQGLQQSCLAPTSAHLDRAKLTFVPGFAIEGCQPMSCSCELLKKLSTCGFWLLEPANDPTAFAGSMKRDYFFPLHTIWKSRLEAQGYY